MGKGKDMKAPVTEKKKKKKDKDKSFLSKSKNIYFEEHNTIDKFVESKKKKINSNNDLPYFTESPRKKLKNAEEPPTSLSPNKKSKKDVELLEGEPFLKKKSKKDRQPIVDISPKKYSNEGSPYKSPSKKKPSSRFEMHSSDSEDDTRNNKKDTDMAAEAVVPDIITSNKRIEDETGWPKGDFIILLENMANIIPEKDSLKYSSRVERLDWSVVKFGDHSAEECKEKWKLVEKKVRGFRILRELVDDAKLWLEKPWSSFYGSHKMNRHPDMPRRPLSSYMLFYMAKKSKYSKKHPNLGLTEISKIIANKFHKLSDSKKEKYVEQSKHLRGEYNEKMQKFLDTHPNESIAMKKKIKEDKTQMPGPKRPLPPSKLFVEEKLKHFNESDELSKAEYIIQIKKMWKNLSGKKKVPWIRWAHENEKKYLEELEIYKSENPNFEVPKIKPLLSKEEVTILERMDGKPEKPPNSAYSLFSRLMLKDDQIKLMKFSPKERMREISRIWAVVSDDEKKQYQEKAKHLLDVYKLEYATYLESLPEDKRAEELAKNQSRKRKKKDVDVGKKLKQTKILDLIKKKESESKGEANVKSENEEDDVEKHDEDQDSEEEQQEQQSDEEEDDILNDPQRVKEIKNKIKSLEPTKPSVDEFELFKEIYLTNPGSKESKAKIFWESLPKKERERYKKKLEAQKQNYVIKYKEFLANLKPHEIKVYSVLKNQSSVHLSDSSEGEESDDEDSSEEEDLPQVARNKSTAENEDSSSSSEESD